MDLDISYGNVAPTARRVTGQDGEGVGLTGVEGVDGRRGDDGMPRSRFSIGVFNSLTSSSHREEEEVRVRAHVIGGALRGHVATGSVPCPFRTEAAAVDCTHGASLPTPHAETACRRH